MKIFDVLPLPALLLLPNASKFTIAEVNGAYLKATGTQSFDLIGKGVFEAFPDGPGDAVADAVAMLRSSLLTVIETKEPHKMAVQKYGIPVWGEIKFEERYWDSENIPILDDAGNIEYIMHITKEITSISKMEKVLDKTIEDLKARNEFIETILENIPLGVAVNRIDDGTATVINKLFNQIYGWREDDFADIQTFFDKIYPDEAYKKEITARIIADIQSGDPNRMHWENIAITTSTGEKRFINVKNIPLFDQNLMISTVIDVTLASAQAAEIYHIKSNQEELINGTKDIIWSIDKNLRLITANRAYQEMIKAITGKQSAEGEEVMVAEFGKELNKKWKKYYQRALNGERFEIKEQVFDPQKNQLVYGLITFHPMFNDNREIFGAACYSKDISDEINSLVALEKNKTQLTKIMDSSLDMICSIADDGIILTVSAACEAILGYKPDELIGKQLFDFIYAEDRERSAGIVARVKQGEHITNFENQYVRKDGTLVPLYWSVKWDPKEKIRYGVARDATEKKKSEAALIQSEHLLREAQKMAKIGSWNFDFQSDTLTWSEALYDVFGANRETFKETHGSFVNLVMEEDRDFVLKTSQHSQETGEPFNIVYRIITPSNELRYIEEFGYVEKGPDVVIKRLFGTAQDITERKKIEDELKKSEENYKYLFENSPVPLMVWDVETLKILDCNEEALYSYGYTREEFLNLTIKDIRPTEDIPLIESYIKTMDICSKLDKAVWRHQKKNGEIIFMDVIRHMMKYNGRKVSFALSRDITESYYYLQLDKLEKDILEKSAQDKTSLVDTLSIYLKGIQDIHPGMLCSVQSVRKNRLHNLASRDIPAEFLQQIDGVEIGENKGSCGTSAYLKQKVIVTDINNDVRWESYKVIAARYGLKACWSCPILNTKSDVVATFACYYKEVRTPSEREKNTIERATQILQLILESDKRKHELEHSNQRFAFAAQATSDIIWDWDLEKNEVYYSDNLEKQFGYTRPHVQSDGVAFFERVHPEDIDKALITQDQIRYGEMVNWVAEYRFKKANGEYAHILDKGIVIRNDEGLGVRMVGAMQDISQQKKEIQHLKLLESVITNAKDSIMITEAEPGNRILYVNQAFTNMTGYTVRDVIGKNPRILQGPKSDKKELKRLSTTLRSWQPCEATLINYKKNGEEFWVNFNVIPIADEKGSFTHWVAIERDVTEQKSTQQALEWAYNEKNTILESIGDAFFAVDKNAVVTYWNKMAEKIFMAPRDQILDHRLSDVFSGSICSESFKKYDEAIVAHRSTRFEDYVPPLNKWFDISAYPSDKGLLFFFKDITDRKFSEILLKELNANITKKAKELAISNAELEQFAYVASHDLQEPLRMVTSFMTQLEKKYGDIIDERGKQYIHFAVDGAKRMRQIILDLLDFSRVGKTDDEQKGIDLNILVNEILTFYRRRIEETQAKVVVHDLPELMGYRSPLRQVFQNLIGNSLKYTTPGVPPFVEVSCEETKTQYKFAVEDNGIGISSAYFDKIFIIFQRLHNKDEYSGTGMGLAITKKIIDNMGGKIWVESEEGKGTTFYFTLPKSNTL